MKQQILFLLTLVLLVIKTADAQVYLQYPGNDSSRIELWGTYTKAEIIKKLGQPAEFETYYDDEVYNATVDMYFYKDFTLEVIGNKLNSFIIDGQNIILTIVDWGMSLKVGDSVLPFKTLPLNKAKIRSFSDQLNLLVLINGVHLDEHLILNFDSNNKITQIEWFVPI